VSVEKLRAPFPWFGGKSRVASIVWDRFGNVLNYVEPFAGSLAVLLGRPHPPRTETVNDRDAYLSNFWRAVTEDPEAVAHYADWPVSEADLHARHRWLVKQADFRERMLREPDFYDVKIAGWWVWGISQWIGGGWCHPTLRRDGSDTEPRKGRPSLQPQGVGSSEWTGRFARCKPRAIHAPSIIPEQRPAMTTNGIHSEPPGNRKRPQLWRGGIGTHSNACLAPEFLEEIKRPDLHRGGRGVTRTTLKQQLPDISGNRSATGRGVHASGKSASADAIFGWFEALQARLRRVRIVCGDWERIMGPSPTFHIGTTGVFLDPPYDPVQIAAGDGHDGHAPADAIYAHHDGQVSADVRRWALEHGGDKRLRIALCGYAGEHDELVENGWSVVAWKTPGGYGGHAKAGRGVKNSIRERIWFSPHCLSRRVSGPLFPDVVEQDHEEPEELAQ
jgi:hypothetical protein